MRVFLYFKLLVFFHVINSMYAEFLALLFSIAQKYSISDSIILTKIHFSYLGYLKNWGLL